MNVLFPWAKEGGLPQDELVPARHSPDVPYPVWTGGQ